MSVRDNQNEKVTFNTVDHLEQKVDRLTVMMSKLVTKEEGHSKSFKHKCISPKEVGIRVEVVIKVGSEIKMHIGNVQCIIKTSEVELEVILIIEGITDITCEVVRGIKTIIMIIEGMTIEVTVMIEIRVGH